jgi:hypothetical protein
MRSSGKLVVLSIFALAIGMASFALWWNWGMGRRSLDYWGESGALLIRDAKSVTLVKLNPRIPKPAAKDPPLPMESRDLSTAEKKDISGVKGLVHARRAFLEDASFEWTEPLPAGVEWQYAVLFAGEKGHIFVMLNLKDGVVGSSESYRALHLNPKTAAGWKLFISRYFPDEVPKASQASPAKAK